MKTFKIFLTCLLGTMLFSGLKAQESGATLPFKGTIQYRIAYESPIIPQEQLAQQPQIASLRVLGEKAIFSMAEQKVLADAQSKELHSLVNLSAMGLGKYHILQTEADLLKESEQESSLKVETTDETKTIFGFNARKIKTSLKEGSINMEMEIWCVEGFGDPFFKYATQAGIKDLPGFPLEYTIKTPDMTMTFSVHKVTNEEVNPKYFNIPSSYKASTEEEMKKDIQEFMQSMQGM